MKKLFLLGIFVIIFRFYLIFYYIFPILFGLLKILPMEYIVSGMIQALQLILSFDPEIYGIIGRSIQCALIATFLASLLGIPLGYIISINTFWGKSFILTVLNTTMALPTVVVGLLAYAFLSRSAPLGFLNLIFTPTAIIIGEFLISLPIIINLTIAAVQAVDRRVFVTALTLGANRRNMILTVLIEARFALLAAVILGFGRAVSEVGSAMMIGGNIRFYTRTMTTAIAMEVSKGEFSFGLALGFFLLLVAFSINILVRHIQMKGKYTAF